ncbi:MAG TPA: hypothetical protein VF503_15715 [Sphingobium sp.]|uniref:hypothetical protein n=1 Tax=Sphingobium sp. TaxID=1912891 RepID=UPI002ED1CA92
MSKDMNPLERAARALCILDGQSENGTIDGRPLWQKYIPEARAALEGAKMEWRPMKSAPLDGSPVLLFMAGEKNVRRQMIVGAWDKDNNRWTAVAAVYRLVPAFWLPLPPAPSCQ